MTGQKLTFFSKSDDHCLTIEQPCQNNGTCVSESKYDDAFKNYTCSCPKGYVDQNCTTCNLIYYELLFSIVTV